MATFNGTSLGEVLVMNTAQAPKQRQVNAYPGVDGLQLIDHGTRGAMTSVQGVLYATGKSGLSSLLDTFRGYQSAGGKATLVDKLSKTWTNVILVQFAPVGPCYPIQGGVQFCQQYEAQFLHPDE